jgi:hypothetical protein
MRIDRRNYAPLEGQGNRTRAGHAVLPLPACGERGGVRGLFHKRKLAAQACGEAPSPGICATSAQIPTSPRKRGEARGGTHMRLPCSLGEMSGRGRWEHS